MHPQSLYTLAIVVNIKQNIHAGNCPHVDLKTPKNFGCVEGIAYRKSLQQNEQVIFYLPPFVQS